MAAGRRALNLVTALAIVLGEALRQTEGFPESGPGAPARPLASRAETALAEHVVHYRGTHRRREGAAMTEPN